VDPDANERNLDWNRWLGKAPRISFAPEQYFSWHKYYAYNSGILGNLLSHTFMPLLMATGAQEFPRRVVATGTRKVSTDREINDTTHLLAEMPSGLTFCVAGSTVNEQGLPEMIRGRKSTIYLSQSQDKAELKPERPFTEEIEPETYGMGGKVGDLARHEQNFFDCIRSGGTPNCSIDVAIRAHTILCLAEMADRFNLALLFDGATRTIKTGEGKILRPLTYETVLPSSS
jgi:predicted dehydrogenase